MYSLLKKPALAFLLLIVLLQSCRVAWVPDYNAAIEDQIIATAQKNDRLYLDMLHGSAPANYVLYSDRYNDIQSEINSIELKNEARRKNEDMLAIIKNLKNAFKEYRKEHEAKKILKDGEILIYQQNIKAFWTPLLVAEHGLKLAK